MIWKQSFIFQRIDFDAFWKFIDEDLIQFADDRRVEAPEVHGDR